MSALPPPRWWPWGARRQARHADPDAEPRAGLSFALLVLPAVVLAVVLIWFVPEHFDRWDPGMGWLIAAFFGLTWGTEWLVVQLTRRRRLPEDSASAGGARGVDTATRR